MDEFIKLYNAYLHDYQRSYTYIYRRPAWLDLMDYRGQMADDYTWSIAPHCNVQRQHRVFLRRAGKQVVNALCDSVDDDPLPNILKTAKFLLAVERYYDPMTDYCAKTHG